MLKRFMNWLLHRVQKVLGVLGGQRGSSRSSKSSQTPPATHNLAQRAADAIAAQNAETAKNDAIATPQANAEPSVPITELDPYRKIDAAAALPIDEPAAPSFPAEVSALLSTSSIQSAEQSAERSLSENQSPLSEPDPLLNDYLPSIHDLLPAVEPNPLFQDSIAEPTASNLLTSPTAAETSEPAIALSDEPSAEVSAETDKTDVAEAQPIKSELESQPEAEPVALILFSSESPSSESPSSESPSSESPSSESPSSESPSSESPSSELPSSELPIEQAVLFSFDIIESQPSQLEEAALEPELQPADSALQISLNIEELSVVADVMEDPEAKDSPAAVESSTHSPTETVSEPSTSAPSTLDKVAELPYPSSLPGSPESAQIERDQIEHDQTSDNNQTSESDAALVKNGVVKLLFTLKEGNFHGYIAPDDGSKDILFHEKYINADIFERLDRGTQVVASIKYMEGKVYATEVHILL